MPADDFGLLKNVFGIEDQEPATTPESKVAWTDPATHDIKAEIQSAADKIAARGVTAMQTSYAEYAAGALGEVAKAMKIPPEVINVPSGHTVDVLPKSTLIQLTATLIVHVKCIKRAEFDEKSRSVIVRLETEHGDRIISIYGLDATNLWKQLEIAATHAIILSTRNSLPASQAEIAEFHRRAPISDDQRQRVQDLARQPKP